MFSAIFQGYNPVVPLLVLIVLSIISMITAWWSYKYLSSIPTWKRRLLILLRASALLILALLLLNPFLTFENIETEKPQIYVYLDNSQSVDVERGNYEGLETYEQILEDLENSLNPAYGYSFQLFGESIQEGAAVTGSENVTNLQSVIDHISQNQGEFVASILLSDGIFTQGRDPTFSAQNLSVPIFTIPLGDTTEVRDVRISDIDYNRLSYTNTLERIRVEVQQDGYGEENAVVQLLEDGDLIQSEEIRFTESTSSHLVEFEVEMTEEGFYDFTVNIPVLENEFDERNNRESFMIEVLDDKTAIFSLAFEVHPDIGAIRRLIASDQQNELIQSNWLRDNRFSGVDPRELESDPDLIILHGLPDENDSVFDWITDQNEIPVLIFQMPQSLQKINSFSEMNPPVSRINNAGSVLDIHLNNTRELYSHPLLEFDIVDFRRFPTLKALRGNYQLNTISELLLEAEYQRVETDIPVLVVQSGALRRMALVNAYGWNRFELSANEDINNFYSDFFTSLISWTTTSPDQRNLTLEPVKDTFTDSESVRIRANLVNESNDPEPDATVEIVTTEAGSDEQQTFRMRSTGGGDYNVDIGSFPEGLYQVEGTARKGDRLIGQAETRFTVSESSLEFVNTKRNDRVLEQLATRTGGLFLSDFEISEMFNLLSEENRDEIVETISSETRYIHDLLFWFILVILLLSAEWIIRRTVSLP